MTDERIIPVEGRTSVVTTSVLVDGQEVPATYEMLSVVTTKEVNRVPKARIVFRDGDAAAEDFELSNAAELVPGKEIEVQAGYGSQEQVIFKGIIVRHGITVRERGSSALTIDCRDEAVKMTVGRKNAYYADQKDSEVIEELIGSYGLTADVEATSAVHPELVQYYATDWDFMLARADANGFLVHVDDGAVAVRAPQLDGSADLSVVHGDTMYEFDAAMDARHQYQAVRSMGWDYSSQEVLEKDGAAASNGQGNLSESDLAQAIGLDEFTLQHTGRLDGQELQAWADAQRLKSSLAKIVGRVKIRGFPDIKPGQRIELNGVGERFNGIAYVTAVRHEIARGEWYTQVQFGLPPEWFARRPDVVEAPASALLPALHGLHVGVTTKLEGDPDGEDRIQVRLPLVAPQGDGIWARVASPDAGNERGVFFRPEIGDEVVVGFLNDDPRDPIVLGMLHSSQKPAPITATDDNHEKGIVTREKMRVHFDDEKKVITIDTPGGNSIVLSDDEQAIVLTDQHGNSITLNQDGITLDGSVITLKAQQGIEQKAGTDFKAEAGTGLNLKAGTQLKAEGSAGAELSTSAIAVLKGSLVKIN